MEKNNAEFLHLLKSGGLTGKELSKLKMDKIPPTDAKVMKDQSVSGQKKLCKVSKIFSSFRTTKVVFRQYTQHLKWLNGLKTREMTCWS